MIKRKVRCNRESIMQDRGQDEKSKWFCRQEHGMDRFDHCCSGTVFSKNMSLDPDKLDQLSSDDRYVRNGTDDETV